MLLERVLEVEDDPCPVLGQQSRIVHYRRQACEDAWGLVRLRLGGAKM